MTKKLTKQQETELLCTLKNRFEENQARHPKIKWVDVEKRLSGNKALWSINEMEISGGEPDVIDFDKKTDKYLFADCSAESPSERRSLCYDQEALESRKKYKPDDSASNVAKEMGIELITEEQYKHLQTLGSFDTKTSSWLKTPDKIRDLGGAIFGDRRFDTVFIYHNGAESYYKSRGFRCCVWV